MKIIELEYKQIYMMTKKARDKEDHANMLKCEYKKKKSHSVVMDYRKKRR